jgi:hypothetical protein
VNMERSLACNTFQTFVLLVFRTFHGKKTPFCRSVRIGTEGPKPFANKCAPGGKVDPANSLHLATWSEKNMGGKKRALPDGGDCEVSCAVPAGASAHVRRCLAPRLPGMPLSVPENARESVMAQGAP